MQFDPAKQPLTFDQLMAMLPLRIGQPLRASDLRDSIQRLYQTGEYADIAVDATLAPAGVNLKFITKPAYFIGYFDVSGVPEPPNEGQLLVATKLTLGATYAPSDTTAAVARITDLLKRNGFYNAGVEPATSKREPTQEVHIDFHADPGQRAKFDGLVANGDTLRPLDKPDQVQRLEAIPRMVPGLASAHRNAPSEWNRQHSILVSQARSLARSGDAGQLGLSCRRSTPSRP